MALVYLLLSALLQALAFSGRKIGDGSCMLLFAVLCQMLS